MLRKEGDDSGTSGQTLANKADDNALVKQLKATFKYHGPYKIIKNIVSLESTLHRVAVTDDEKFIFAGGNGCKVRKRDVQVQNSNTYSEKSRQPS